MWDMPINTDRSFSLSRNKHGTKAYIGNRRVEEAKKMKCYKRLIYKQFVQISGLCGPQFLSYLPKRFTHLCRALYGDAILVYSFSTQIWPRKSAKTSGVRELVYVRINTSSNTLIRGETLFQRDSIPILMSRTVKTRKFKLSYFRNETCYGTGKMYKDLFFVYLQLSVNKKS